MPELYGTIIHRATKTHNHISLRCSITNIPRRQMSTEPVVARLKSSGLLQTKGLIGGKWIDASDGRTFEEEAKRVYGDVIPLTLPDRRLFVLKQFDFCYL